MSNSVFLCIPVLMSKAGFIAQNLILCVVSSNLPCTISVIVTKSQFSCTTIFSRCSSSGLSLLGGLAVAGASVSSSIRKSSATWSTLASLATMMCRASSTAVTCGAVLSRNCAASVWRSKWRFSVNFNRIRIKFSCGDIFSGTLDEIFLGKKNESIMRHITLNRLISTKDFLLQSIDMNCDDFCPKRFGKRLFF